ncbi:Ketol-acid reductoisomerase (NADP(+)), partial [Frankliniella fusca]
VSNIATVNHGIVNFCIDDAILCFLHIFNYGIFTCQLQCVAIMKIGTDTNAQIHFSLKEAEGTRRMSQLEQAGNAKKLKNDNKKLSNIQKQKVMLEAVPASTADLVNKIYDLRIRVTETKYERTEEMKVKNVQQISERYQTNAEVREYKYQTDEVFRELHSSKMKQKYHDDESYHDKLSSRMREKMREKYQTDEFYHDKLSSRMREKYQTDVDYHNKVLESVKISYHTLQGAKRKSNYQNMYQSSNKTKICLREKFNEQKKEMPTVICTCRAQLFCKKSTVSELSLKIDQTLSISDLCTYRHHLGENESGNVCSTCAYHLKKVLLHWKNTDNPSVQPFNTLKCSNIIKTYKCVHQRLNTWFISERLVSARIPFMQIRELGYQKQLGLKGNCVNVPIDIKKTVTCLPRMDSEDDTLLAQLIRKMSDKTPYAFENVRPENVFNAARYLVNTDLYKQHNITLNESWSQQFHDETNNTTDLISTSNTEDSTEQVDEIDDLMDQQETLLTSGLVADSGVKIAPGEGNMPLSLTLDEDMDVLAFPTVYGGKQRIFKVKYTPVEMAKAEARHHDRRVATNIPK